MIYENLLNLLPSRLKEDGNAENLKKIIKVYSDITSNNDESNLRYGNLLDIYGAVGGEIDFIGNMYYVFRTVGEADSIYRDRIVSTIIARRTPTTIPEIQNAIDSVVSSGHLSVLENYNNSPASVYLTGTADEESILRSLDLAKRFLPAGVSLYVPIVSLNTWQSVKDQFTAWQSLEDENYIW